MGVRVKRQRGDNGERTCVGTRTIAPQSELIRWFVGPDGTHWPDWTGQTQGRFGRGVYTLRTTRAIELGATRRQLIGGVTVLLPRVQQAAERAFWDRLSLACRANALSIGQIAVRERLGKGTRVGLMVVAADAGSAGIDRVHDHALHRGATVVTVRDGYALGAALGREFVSSVLCEESAFSRDICSWAPSMVQQGGVVVSVETTSSEKIKLEPPGSND